MNGNIYAVRSYAKVNLFLDAARKRQDGYHDIISVMQKVSLHDEMSFTIEKSGGVSVFSAERITERAEENTAFRAADAFLKAVGEKNRGVSIRIKKNIPMRAGFGGGSGNAGTILSGLNKVFGDPLSQEELSALALSVGADVPFFALSETGCAAVRGIGEKIEDLRPLKDCFFLLATPEKRVATADAYAKLDELHSNFKKYVPKTDMFSNCVNALENGDTELLCGNVFNLFDEVYEGRTDLSYMKRIMKENGASAVSVSGSGPSLFGIFAKESAAKRAYGALKEINRDTFICVPVSGAKGGRHER